MNSSINRFAGLMSAVFDGVCELFVETILNIIFLLNVMVPFYWRDHE